MIQKLNLKTVLLAALVALVAFPGLALQASGRRAGAAGQEAASGRQPEAAAGQAAAPRLYDVERTKPRGASDFLGDKNSVDGGLAKSLLQIVEMNVPNATKIPVLLYHHLVPEADLTPELKKSQETVTVERFRKQMRYLYDHKYYAASVGELDLYLRGDLVLPERTVVITFDDGYKSNAEYAYPILKRLKFKAAVFIISSLIGESGEKKFLGWNDIRQCADVFTYCSHTHDLHKQRASGLTDFITADRKQVDKDLARAREILETSYFAYPHGQASAMAKLALRTNGFRLAFGTDRAYVGAGSDPFDLPRFIITPQVMDDLFEAICGGDAHA